MTPFQYLKKYNKKSCPHYYRKFYDFFVLIYYVVVTKKINKGKKSAITAKKS